MSNLWPLDQLAHCQTKHGSHTRGEVTLLSNPSYVFLYLALSDKSLDTPWSKTATLQCSQIIHIVMCGSHSCYLVWFISQLCHSLSVMIHIYVLSLLSVFILCLPASKLTNLLIPQTIFQSLKKYIYLFQNISKYFHFFLEQSWHFFSSVTCSTCDAHYSFCLRWGHITGFSMYRFPLTLDSCPHNALRHAQASLDAPAA